MESKVHSAPRPLIGLLLQPRVIMMMEKLVEWLAGEIEILGENLPQCRYVHHKTHMLPGREPGPPRWEKLSIMKLLIVNFLFLLGPDIFLLKYIQLNFFKLR
jgi:hypothetical protein